MKCPFCSSTDTRVLDSRSAFEGLAIRRRRFCSKCETRFSTWEERELANFLVIKKNGGKEPYSREKLEVGLRKALEKRPISGEEFQELVLSIERDISHGRKKEIPSNLIGKTTLLRLKKIDPVAYLRFASVYLDFKSIKGFDREIKKLIKR